MATIADVAREAEVSVATVSRVLNGQDVVRPETARRVYQAVEKLQYEPNLLARNFRKSESRVLLIVAPNMTNPYYAHILAGIGDEANQHGYSALIYNTTEDPVREREAFAMLEKRRADGAVLMGSAMGSRLLKKFAEGYALVQCCEYDPDVDIPHVSIDNYAATRQAMEYLVELGHRHIATISSSNNYISTQQRLQAWRDVLSEHGLPAPDEYVGYASDDYSYKSGTKAARALLSLARRPTALFCISDTLALGAVTTAKEMGLAVPEDVAVVGFDDVEFTTMFHPYITTIAQPCYDLGRYSVRLLLDQMQGGGNMQRQLYLPHRLIQRESTRPL